MKHNKSNKAGCKKPFLVVKVIMSMCANGMKSTIRMKSTIKQETIELIKEHFFAFKFSGRSNPRGLQHYHDWCYETTYRKMKDLFLILDFLIQSH